MKEKTTINPAYVKYADFLASLPDIMESAGRVVQDRRNLIKALEHDGTTFNVKRFRKPIWINRVVYTLFRAPKARKAYRNAEVMLSRGFSTPEPIALIEQYEGGLIGYSYFVSLQLDAVREIREYYFSEGGSADLALLGEFARYTAALHEAEIYHKDYSPGNILIRDTETGPQFSLVDINRMKFGRVGMEAGCANFARLFEHDRVARFIAGEYAAARGFAPAQCIACALRYKHSFERQKRRKLRLKKFMRPDRR